MPPMVLDNLGGWPSQNSSLPICPVPISGSTTFKHPVPFRSSNVIVAIPARLPPGFKTNTTQSHTFPDEPRNTFSDLESDSEPGQTGHIAQRGRRRNTHRVSTESNRGYKAETFSTQIAISEADVERSPPIYPESQSRRYKPPLHPCSEQTAVRDLLVEVDNAKREGSSVRSSESDFVEFELSDFSIYLPGTNKTSPYELRGLQHLATRNGHSSFLFDGILSTGNRQRYVTAVPFQICSIGNYGEDVHEVGSDIWLQSDQNTKTNIYYRLKDPSPQYNLYHEGFVWLANLAKHFVDYSQAAPENTVSIHNFRSDFSRWVKKHHDMSPEFQNWYKQYGNDDFRRQITTNIKFLFKEAVGVNSELTAEPIFNEILELNSVPQQKIVEEKTIVTPYVYECFKHLRFGDHLKAVDIASVPRLQQVTRGVALNLTKDDHVEPSRVEVRVEIPSSDLAYSPRIIETRSPQSNQVITIHQRMISSIKPGDVLSVVKDGKDSLWKDEISQWKAADDCWYVCVQAVHKIADGSREFDAIWLYKPSDTSCAKMKYPFPNELFLSDNCTCEQKRITESEVLRIVKICWSGNPSEQDKRLFVRQTYLENERFVTFNKGHKRCKHMQTKGATDSTAHRYQIGQTVLAAPLRKSKHTLEPYEIVQLTMNGDKEEVALLRRLQRRQAVDGKGRPNELVYTEVVDRIAIRKIDGPCLVRFYPESALVDSAIPAPYSRDGTGNAFYITTRLVDVNGMGTLQPIEHNIPTSLLQGFDPLKNTRRLRGLDLYCGGGNFGRGLEEGGAVQNKWAVDIDRTAIHTYAANLKDPEETKLFFGSVNDMLSQALQGNPQKSDLIPAPGDVDCVSAGSPCQGFSLMNQNRNSVQGLRNQSLVASVAAYIDFYRPKYGLLENVMSMAQKGRGRDEDVLSQLICAIVGLGYQLRMFVVDAWSCGMPQSRTRLFVSFAAPGLKPLEHPKLSHSHPTSKERSLGQMANGEAFGMRVRGPTPFEYISAGSGTADLPNINEGCTYQCIQQPEHIMPYHLPSLRRRQIEAIPTTPRGMNFYKTYSHEKGIMTSEQAALFCMYDGNGKVKERVSKTSRAWGRIDPKGLIPAVLSRLHVSDARNGPCIHWDEHRIMTVMEAKRAQGFLDDEILVGSSSDGFKILGNSVARGVALAFGLSLHEAWLEDAPNTLEITTPLVPVIHEDTEKAEGRRIDPSRSRRSKHVVPLVNDSSQAQGNATSGTASNDVSSESESYIQGLVRSDQPTKNGVSPSSSARFHPWLLRQSLSATASAGGSSSSSSQDVYYRKAPQSREVRASSESSVDERDISTAVFGRFTSYIAARKKNQSPFGSATNFAPHNQSAAGSLKRRFDMLGPATPENHKVLRSESYIMPERDFQDDSQPTTSYTIVSPSRNGTDKRIDASILADRLADLQNNQRREYSAHGPIPDSESESDADIKFIPAASYNVSAVKANQNYWHRLPEEADKAAPKAKVVISLLSDDEDNQDSPPLPTQKRRDVASKESARKASNAPLPNYAPVDNSSLNAYAQTNSYMKFDVNRRHGPKSTW